MMEASRSLLFIDFLTSQGKRASKGLALCLLEIRVTTITVSNRMFRLSKNSVTSFVRVVGPLTLTTCCLAMSPGACRRGRRKHARLLRVSNGARWLQDPGSCLPRCTAPLATRPEPAGESQILSINPESFTKRTLF